MSTIQALENEIGLLKEEYEKFERGNKSAGTRARKILQNIKRLSQERGEIDEMLARPNANGSSVAELMKARAHIERRLATAEQSWLEASEAVERAARTIAQ